MGKVGGGEESFINSEGGAPSPGTPLAVVLAAADITGVVVVDTAAPELANNPPGFDVSSPVIIGDLEGAPPKLGVCCPISNPPSLPPKALGGSCGVVLVREPKGLGCWAARPLPRALLATEVVGPVR